MKVEGIGDSALIRGIRETFPGGLRCGVLEVVSGSELS